MNLASAFSYLIDLIGIHPYGRHYKNNVRNLINVNKHLEITLKWPRVIEYYH